jgi:ferrous iron transport protein B
VRRVVTWTDRLARVLTHRIWGTAVFLALMFVVFWAIFALAKPLMDLIDSGREAVGDAVKDLLDPGPLRSLLVDGVVKGLGSVVVFLPQIVILFGFVAILEDCGYMARAAFLMDKLMARCGLSGKSFIPMLSSVACAVPGIMATRVIENRRDRLATILVAPLMSCSARLPVYILLIGTFLPDNHLVAALTMFAMYSLGLVLAPLVALLLKRTLLRGETPLFVMEMPLYKRPSLRTVCRRMTDSSWAFLRRAGTLILATMIVVWALTYFPCSEPPERTAEYLAALRQESAKLEKELGSDGADKEKIEAELTTTRAEIARTEAEGQTFDGHVSWLEKRVDDFKDQAKALDGKDREKMHESAEEEQKKLDELNGEWKAQSWLGRMGKAIEPVVRPLGWDWRIGMAALASFPAREVVVGTLGIIYSVGDVKSDDIRNAERPGDTELGKALQAATWDDDPGRRVFTIPVALSLMVFFALCCQCASTLAVIRRETRSWLWPVFTLTYMTLLAYLGAFLTFQAGSLLAAEPK